MVTSLEISLCWLTVNDFISVETLSEDEEDIPEGCDGSISVSAMSPYKGASDFSPTPGGPFSALTPSMWPQDIMLKLGNPVSNQH